MGGASGRAVSSKIVARVDGGNLQLGLGEDGCPPRGLKQEEEVKRRKKKRGIWLGT